MRKSKINISIIIVNYKSDKETLRCAYNLFRLEGIEIIVVDNSNSFSLKKSLKDYSQEIIYINPKRNIGYGNGNNLGAFHAKGKYLLILNPDTILQPNVLQNLFGFIERNENIAVVAPLLVDGKGRVVKQISTQKLTPVRQIFTYTFVVKLLPNNKVMKDFLKENTKSEVPYEVEVVPGSAFIIRKNVFDKLGGFDKNYFLYFEENDLFKRVKEEGYKIYKVPSAKVFHKWQPAEGDGKLKKYFEASRFYYFKKHYGLISALIVELFSRKWWNF